MEVTRLRRAIERWRHGVDAAVKAPPHAGRPPGQWDPGPGPFSGPGHLRRVAPYALAAIVGVGCISLSIGATSRTAIAIDISAFVTMTLAVLMPWSKVPRSTQAIIPLMCSAFTYPALHADGGLASPSLPLLIVPVLWLIVYENALAYGIGLGSATVFVAVEMIGASRQDVLRGVTALVVGCLILPTIRRLVLAEHAHTESLTDLADQDALTGLANRRVLDRRLSANGDGCVDGRGLIFIDLNGFKAINDELGHDAGDRLLIQVAGRITNSLRGTDFAARIGGDEFVVVCDGDSSAVRTVADRVEAAIRERPYQLDATSVAVSASIGVSHTGSVDADADSLLRNADEAMYRAKRKDRVGWSPITRNELDRRLPSIVRVAKSERTTSSRSADQAPGDIG